MLLRTHSHDGLTADARELFNEDEAMALVEGDAELFQDLVKIFLEDLPRQLASIRQAIEWRRPDDLQRSAHHLKASACAVGSQFCVNLALELEEIGRRGDIGPAFGKFAELERALAQLSEALKQLARFE